jgi:hypothetical protein
MFNCENFSKKNLFLGADEVYKDRQNIESERVILFDFEKL